MTRATGLVPRLAPGCDRGEPFVTPFVCDGEIRRSVAFLTPRNIGTFSGLEAEDSGFRLVEERQDEILFVLNSHEEEAREPRILVAHRGVVESPVLFLPGIIIKPIGDETPRSE